MIRLRPVAVAAGRARRRRDCQSRRMDGSEIRTEAAIRRELAALYRVFDHFGWTDLTSTHISARLPDDPEHYLLNSYDWLFGEITASRLCKVSFNGEMVERGRTMNVAGHLIHSGILAARPDIHFVAHSHTRAGIAVSCLPEGLLPLSQQAGVVLGTLAVHRYQDSTAVADEVAVMARDLGGNYCMLLRNHGLLTVGRNAAEVFLYHYYLEAACRIQVDTLAMTREPVTITPEALAPLLAWGDPANGPKGALQWAAMLRLLERTAPDYRD